MRVGKEGGERCPATPSPTLEQAREGLDLVGMVGTWYKRRRKKSNEEEDYREVSYSM